MKRIILTSFYLILTLMISAAGFFLPASLSAYQDQQILATIEHPSIEPMEFTYSSSLPDTLQLLARGCYYVDYPSTGSTRTTEEVFSIIRDIFKQLEDYGIAIFPLDASAASYNMSLQLAIASEDTDAKYGKSDADGSSSTATESTDGSQTPFSKIAEKADRSNDKPNAAKSADLSTAVIWNCSIYDTAGYWADIKIDDKSGKLVAFNLTADQACFSIDSKANLNRLVKVFHKFLRRYYEMKTKAVLQNTIQAAYGIYGKSDRQPPILEAEYIIQLTEESGNLIQIPFVIRTEHISLNYIPY